MTSGHPLPLGRQGSCTGTTTDEMSSAKNLPLHPSSSAHPGVLHASRPESPSDGLPQILWAALYFR